MRLNYDELIEEIIRDIVFECSSGEYVCDITLIPDYGIDIDSPLGKAIESEVNKRLTNKYLLKDALKKG